MTMPDAPETAERAADAKPGSREAVERGCTCPVIDNHYGRGIPGGQGLKWWISETCPLHSQGTLARPGDGTRYT